MSVIKCVVCDTKIGERVQTGTTPFGKYTIPLMEEVYDESITCRVWWRASTYKQGLLCKKCANEIFPEGKWYRVRFKYKGKTLDVVNGGQTLDGVHTTYASAKKLCDDCNKKHPKEYWIEEYPI